MKRFATAAETQLRVDACQESNQIPVHQLMKRRDSCHCHLLGLENDVVMQQESNVANAIVEPSSLQQVQHDDNMLNPQERRLLLKSQQVMSPN